MEARGAADGGPRSTGGDAMLSNAFELEQLQGSLLQDAPQRGRAATSTKRQPGRLVRLAVWLTLFYLLPQNPRAEALNFTWAVVDVPSIPFVTPFTHGGLEKVLGRWYVVKDAKPRSIYHYPIYEWCDIWFDENGIMTAQWFTKSEWGYVLTPPGPIRADVEIHEFDEEEWDEDEPVLWNTEAVLSPDEGYLSMTVCGRHSSNCTAVTLSREVAHADGSADAEAAQQKQQQQQQEQRTAAAQRGLGRAGRLLTMPCRYNATTSRLHCDF